MARTPTSLNSNVFINCPFDEDYRSCFEAILFTVTVSGYQARTALEEDDAGDIRLDKLCRLITACDRTVHDLSRTESSAEGLPRFNMPFELGLAIGARQFGRGKQRAKRACLMVAKPYVMPRFLSDLAGNDPQAHNGDPLQVMRIVRDHLHEDPTGRLLPGGAHMADLLDGFHADLPSLLQEFKLTLDEVHPYRGYRNYMAVLHSFCVSVGEVAEQR